MKTGIFRGALFAFSLVAGLLLFASCKKPVAQEAAEDETVPSPSTAGARLATSAAAPVAMVTPVPDPLAPPGVFFLLQKASITTDDGIVGLKPGQVLLEVSPGTYRAGEHTVELRPEQVTNNLRIARQFAVADAASQAALRQAMQATPQPVSSAPAPRVAAAPAPPRPRAAAPSGNSLTAGPKLGGGTGAADSEVSNRKNVRIDSSGRQYWRDSRGAIRYDF